MWCKTLLKIDDHESVFPNVFFPEVIDIYIHREKSWYSKFRIICWFCGFLSIKNKQIDKAVFKRQNCKNLSSIRYFYTIISSKFWCSIISKRTYHRFVNFICLLAKLWRGITSLKTLTSLVTQFWKSSINILLHKPLLPSNENVFFPFMPQVKPL